ncbi:MAG: DUF418 domain-containing protein [Bacteroidales bacterium]|nr:DUF418 domain-containing protein [Bacteroidales bacterium]
MILFLLNIEHFDLYFLPDHLPDWMKSMDAKIWNGLFFLFSGKAYSIFALLFGFTYYIQYNNQKELGKDFSSRFAWRMLLLLGFGLFNTLFYAGDILTIYALIGCVLIPIRKLPPVATLIIAFLLILQPVEWIRAISAHMNSIPAVEGEVFYGKYYHMLYETQKSPNFFTMISGNITHGRLGTILWNWDHGRFFQTAGLFMLGYVLGKKNRFAFGRLNLRFWNRTLIASILSFVVLFVYHNYFSTPEQATYAGQIILSIVKTWSDLAFTFILISVFILVYYNGGKDTLSFFKPLGRMSLTNYIMQSVLGALVYYQSGLALYKYTGATLSLLIGMLLCLLQWLFCSWWLKNHSQGPLEKIWHDLTWIKKPKK